MQRVGKAENVRQDSGEKRRRIRVFLIILAIFSALLFYFLGPISFEKFKVHIETGKKPESDHRVYYHDFDHDGFSEEVRLKTGGGLEPAIKIFTHEGKLIDQWNFLEPWIPRSLVFGDYDGDHYDEAYCFTMTKDSLFLYGIDPRQIGRFFIFRKFIVSAPVPNPNRKGKWDVQGVSSVFADLNGDGYQDLVFLVSAGFSLQPRRVFGYDIHGKKILGFSPLSGAKLGKPVAFDINRDHQPEILFRGCNATDNYSHSFPYRDNKSWLMVLNNHLNFLFPPIPFGSVYSGIASLPFVAGNKTYIVVLKQDFGRSEKCPVLYLFSPKGKKIREKKLSSKIKWRLFVFPLEERNHLFLYRPDGRVSELDPNFKTIRNTKLPTTNEGFILEDDLDGDLKPEYVFDDAEGLTIWSSNFKNFVHVPIVRTRNFETFSVRKNGKLPPDLAFCSTKGLYFLQYRKNPLYPLRFLLLLALALFFYSIYELIALILRKFFFYDRFWQILFRHSSQGIALLNSKGHVVNVNGILDQQLGMKHHVEVGEPFEKAFSERPEIVSIIQRFFENAVPIDEEITFSTEKGMFRGRMRVTPLLGPWKLLLGGAVELTDFTRPMQAERFKTWSKTAQKLAHDIKTPLAAIQLTLQTLQLKLQEAHPEKSGQVAQDFHFLEKEIQRIRNITKDFLRFTNLETPQLRPVSFSKIVESALSRFQLQYSGSITFQLDLDPQYDYVLADPSQIELVLHILIENAVDAMEGEGQILISTNMVQNLLYAGEKSLEIEIADSGKGISNENVDKVFEPYFTTKPEGTGMGLAIARKIIEEHGGEITLTARENFATVVRILLPLGNMEEETRAEDSGH